MITARTSHGEATLTVLVLHPRLIVEAALVVTLGAAPVGMRVQDLALPVVVDLCEALELLPALFIYQRYQTSSKPWTHMYHTGYYFVTH